MGDESPFLSARLYKDVAKRACFTQMLGAWLIAPDQFSVMFKQAMENGIPVALEDAQDPTAPEEGRDLGVQDRPYEVTGGVAVLPIQGPLTKHAHSFQAMFGGSSTAQLRRAIRLALRDSEVKALFFHIDSPGGTVAGTGDLGDDIFAAGQVKPTIAYCEDLCASAALWLSSQANVVLSSPYAEVGSIGVIHVIHDTSKMHQDAGIKVIAIRSSDIKGGHIDGVPVSKKVMDKLQDEVDETAKLFVRAVMRGRGMSEADATAIATGEVWRAPEAMDLGLVDRITTIDEALAIASRLGDGEPIDSLIALPEETVDEMVSANPDTAATTSGTYSSITSETTYSQPGDVALGDSLESTQKEDVLMQPENHEEGKAVLPRTATVEPDAAGAPSKPKGEEEPRLTRAEVKTMLAEAIAAKAELPDDVKAIVADYRAERTERAASLRKELTTKYGVNPERIEAAPLESLQMTRDLLAETRAPILPNLTSVPDRSDAAKADEVDRQAWLSRLQKLDAAAGVR